MGRLFTPRRPAYILASAAVGGYEERRGPFGESFDFCDDNDRFGADTYELAEAEMARLALSFAFKKAERSEGELSLLFGGDLQNQCVATSGGPASVGAPFLGLFGACSTMVEGLGLGLLSLSADVGLSLVGAVSSSHYAAAERQFRTPLEYGGQRTPTAQWTATAAGAVLLTPERQGVALEAFLPGRVLDAGVNDAANMGAAMAPAAADTLLAYFEETGEKPSDFDVILTGDLGKEGSSLLYSLVGERLPGLQEVHRDAGCLIYNPNIQDVHAGGSGCGCIASLLSAHFLPSCREGRVRRMLAIGTGALMNPMYLAEGRAIAGIAHLVRIAASPVT